jgi:hypothetical protein
MTLYHEVNRAALDQALKNAPQRQLCKVLDFQVDSPGGPTVICVPYARLKDSRPSFPSTPEGENAFRGQHARQLHVAFPMGQRFFIDSEIFDVYSDAPFNRARECYPVMKPDARMRDYRVPAGFTITEVIDQNIDPKDIRMRIKSTRGLLKSKAACHPDEPRYPRVQDIWNGPLRFDLDAMRTEIWGAPGRMIARFDRGVTDLLTQVPRFPLAAGTSVVWKDKGTSSGCTRACGPISRASTARCPRATAPPPTKPSTSGSR